MARRDILDKIRDDLLLGQEVMMDVKVGGHVWTLKVLNSGEEVWRDRFVALSPSASFLSGRKIATLAVAICKIDDVPVEEIFENISSDEAENSASSLVGELVGIVTSARYKAAEYLKSVLEELPMRVIDTLYAKWSELDDSYQKGVEKVLGNF